jgi:endo-1,4-beta-mannosidase
VKYVQDLVKVKVAPVSRFRHNNSIAGFAMHMRSALEGPKDTDVFLREIKV